ncbi:MAG TPA: alpha-ketoacid dehydrogenase subunit beta [Candidatus Krumholzibacteriaceae bacterium]|nr:alpha-ketoacid dehydrogenase subunit beta [Candidatus Krumholzibacteriaceae bacterium]
MRGRVITYVEAINEALRAEMSRDPEVILFGENVSSSWRPSTKGLKELFGRERVRDAPITETAFIGAGVGAAVVGMKPVVELMLVGFGLVAMDQILNQMAKTTYMTGGEVNVPMVLRAIYGAGGGNAATHSESLYGVYAHMPGMKVAVPSNPYDAKGLLITAIRDPNPVVFFEHRLLGRMEGEVPEEPYTVPFGVANLVREGADVTVVAVGKMVQEAAKAADTLKGEVSVEVMDPRTLVPLDEEAVLRSVQKTGRLVAVDEDYERCGFTSEVAAVVAEKGFRSLKAPVARVANPNTPIPFNRSLERHMLPDADKIVRAIRNVVK